MNAFRFPIKTASALMLTAVACIGAAAYPIDTLSHQEFLKSHENHSKLLQEAFAKNDYQAVKKLVGDHIALFALASKADQKAGRSFQANNYYNLACAYSMLGQKGKALDALETSVKQWGYTDAAHAERDEDLNNIRKDKRYAALIKEMHANSNLGILQKAGGYQAENTDNLPPFTYESAGSENLQTIKKYFKLDSIAGGGNEISKILNLMAWVHNNIRHDGSNAPPCEYTAIDFYHYHKATGKGINCRHLAITLNEFYLAMGFKSRFVTCMPKDPTDPDCHVINTVYSDSLQKWIWVDPTFNAYVQDENGVFLSIADVRSRLIAGLPVFLNEDANWNNERKQTAEHYLYVYMAKNLYWFDSHAASRFNAESSYSRSGVVDDMITLTPIDHKGSKRVGKYLYNTSDAEWFWQKPK